VLGAVRAVSGRAADPPPALLALPPACRRRRYLLGVTDDERQQRRDEILGTTQKDFRRFAETLEVLRGDGAARVVAVTSADKAKAVLEERPGFWEVKRVI